MSATCAWPPTPPKGRHPFDYPKLSGIAAGVFGLAIVLQLLARLGGLTIRLFAFDSIIWLILVVSTCFGFLRQNQLYEQSRERSDHRNER